MAVILDFPTSEEMRASYDFKTNMENVKDNIMSNAADMVSKTNPMFKTEEELKVYLALVDSIKAYVGVMEQYAKNLGAE